MKFNEGFRKGSFKFNKEQDRVIKKHEEQLKERVEDFFNCSMTLPTLISCKEGKLNNKLVEEIINDIATDKQKVRQLYECLIRNNSTPNNVINPELLDIHWLEFRWVQIKFIYTLDIFSRYNANVRDLTSKSWIKIEHDMLDMEYVILGSLTGALASRDTKRARKIFKLVCPNGLLIP